MSIFLSISKNGTGGTGNHPPGAICFFNPLKSLLNHGKGLNSQREQGPGMDTDEAEESH